MSRISVVRLTVIRQAAANGVDYSPKRGAVCPGCGKRTKVTNTQKWDGNMRIRYHRCQHSSCVLSTMGDSIKSIEVDLVEVG